MPGKRRWEEAPEAVFSPGQVFTPCLCGVSALPSEARKKGNKQPQHDYSFQENTNTDTFLHSISFIFCCFITLQLTEDQCKWGMYRQQSEDGNIHYQHHLLKDSSPLTFHFQEFLILLSSEVMYLRKPMISWNISITFPH